MSKSPWRIDEKLFPKSGLKIGDATFRAIWGNLSHYPDDPQEMTSV
jgi:hypothetical protein